MHVVPFLRYSASKNGVTLKLGLGVVQRHWKWRRSIDHYMQCSLNTWLSGWLADIRSDLRTTFYWSAIVNIALSQLGPIWYRFWVTWRWMISWPWNLEVTRGHFNWYRSKAWVRFPICIPWLSCVICEIKRDIGQKSWFFHTPLHSTPPLGVGWAVGILPSRLVWK